LFSDKITSLEIFGWYFNELDVFGQYLIDICQYLVNVCSAGECPGLYLPYKRTLQCRKQTRFSELGLPGAKPFPHPELLLDAHVHLAGLVVEPLVVYSFRT
jgi:hypothetical protein